MTARFPDSAEVWQPQLRSIPIPFPTHATTDRFQWILRSKSDPDLKWRTGRYSRIFVLLAFTLIPFWGIYRGIAALIAGGSPIAYLCVIPVLAAMIAYGYRTPPRGVGDPESDWILAAVVGGLGLLLRHLMSDRFPTLSGLWQLPLLGTVLWAACLAAVLFGVRRAMQTWPMWAFLFATATPLPYLLLTAAAGGGVLAIAATTGFIGAVAVAIAGTLSPMGKRMGAAAASAALSVGAGVVAAGAGVHPGSVGAMLVTALTGGVIPVAAFLLLQRHSAAPEPATRPTVPERSAVSLIALILGAAVVFGLNRPFGATEAAPPEADGQWTAHANLGAEQAFPFIERYLGPHSTFQRYSVASRPGAPGAAVDVITTDNLAALQTYRDAIWYPVTAPPNYRTHKLGDTAVAEGRAVATDSSLATSGGTVDWYAVTWSWQVGAVYQQVFVVVNQTWMSQQPPPVPVALTLRANVIGPALWLVRQQADPANAVDPIVTARAQQIIGEVMAAGEPRHD